MTMFSGGLDVLEWLKQLEKHERIGAMDSRCYNWRIVFFRRSGSLTLPPPRTVGIRYQSCKGTVGTSHRDIRVTVCGGTR